MSESDTMFDERDRRCAAVQLMLPTEECVDALVQVADPRSKDNRTISTKCQNAIPDGSTLNRYPRVMKTKCPGTVMTPPLSFFLSLSLSLCLSLSLSPPLGVVSLTSGRTRHFSQTVNLFLTPSKSA